MFLISTLETRRLLKVFIEKFDLSLGHKISCFIPIQNISSYIFGPKSVSDQVLQSKDISSLDIVL